VSVTIALFADRAFMDIEAQPTDLEARAFVSGCAHAAKLYEREMTGYLLPHDESLMRQLEDDTECDRAMTEWRGVTSS
jgi:hypothetical protein